MAAAGARAASRLYPRLHFLPTLLIPLACLSLPFQPPELSALNLPSVPSPCFLILTPPSEDHTQPGDAQLVP